VPNPVNLSFNTDGIIGTGAELVNCFAVGRGKDVILSQHMGDLKNMETYDFYTQTLQKFKHTFRVTPKIIVCDKHPNYLSTRFAQESGLPVAEVQHHHAHIASCMAENDIHQQVIGIVMDGTGYGDDGNIWGGEIMISDISSYQRCFHFHYVPIPGGDAAIKEPWRTGLAYLYKSFGDALYDLSIPFVQCLNKNNTGLLLEAMDKDINAPLSSSAGRLFDAIAAITGICTRASYHAEAPMRLEAAIESDIDTFYDYDIKNGLISFFPMIRAIVEDISSGLPVSLIAAKFHNTVCEAVINTAKYINNQYHIDKVVLTGGSFQNRYLLSHTVQKLADEGFDVYTHQKVPCNDAGIALGQVAVAGNMNLFKDNDC
jgi:hydrogenase maturation protein HypF